jgi:hypothetical protein
MANEQKKRTVDERLSSLGESAWRAKHGLGRCFQTVSEVERSLRDTRKEVFKLKSQLMALEILSLAGFFLLVLLR